MSFEIESSFRLSERYRGDLEACILGLKDLRVLRAVGLCLELKVAVVLVGDDLREQLSPLPCCHLLHPRHQRLRFGVRLRSEDLKVYDSRLG